MLFSIPSFPASQSPTNWVVVKEFNLSYYIGEATLITSYTHYGNLVQFPNSNPQDPET